MGSKAAVDVDVETSVAPDAEWNSKLKRLTDEIDETKFEIAQTYKECRLVTGLVDIIGGYHQPRIECCEIHEFEWLASSPMALTTTLVLGVTLSIILSFR